MMWDDRMPAGEMKMMWDDQMPTGEMKKWREWCRHWGAALGYYRPSDNRSEASSDLWTETVERTSIVKGDCFIDCVFGWLSPQCCDHFFGQLKKKIPLSSFLSWQFSFENHYSFKKYLPVKTCVRVCVAHALCCIRNDTTNGMGTTHTC